MKRGVVFGGILCLIGSTLLTGCNSSDDGLRAKSGLIGEWSGRGGCQLVYRGDGTVADLASGMPPSRGTYDVERLGSQWVETYTDSRGKRTRYFFTVSADKLRVYFSSASAKSGGTPAATYLRAK